MTVKIISESKAGGLEVEVWADVILDANKEVVSGVVTEIRYLNRRGRSTDTRVNGVQKRLGANQSTKETALQRPDVNNVKEIKIEI